MRAQNTKKHIEFGIKMVITAITILVGFFVLLLVSDRASAQIMVPSSAPKILENTRNDSGRKKPFGFTYQYSRRDLSETSAAEEKRNERLQDPLKPYFSPESISFDQHIIGFRYSLSDDLELEAGTSYLKSTVNLKGQTFEGAPVGFGPPPMVKKEFETGSEGMSDTRFGANYEVLNWGTSKVVLKGIINAPTGSVEEKDQGRFLPYAGQLGSGTWDFMPEVAYTNGTTGLVSGSRLQYTLRTGKSDRDYRMGNQALVDTFVGYDYKRMAALFLKGRLRNWQESKDPRYEDPNSAEDDPYVKSGTRWEVLASTRFGIPLPSVGALILEAGIPLYQDQNSGDVQLETEFTVNSRLVASF